MGISVVWDQDGSVTVSLNDVVDRDTVPQVRRYLFKNVVAKRPRRLVVEMSAVQRMDTAGVALLVELRNAMSRQNAEFCLKDVTEPARRLIGLARVHNLLNQRD